MEIAVYLVKSFTKDKSQGNPAGVVLDAEKLTAAQMLKIASVIGFSETAFVRKSLVADFNVRFFAPKTEVDLCGHATIAAFYTLCQTGRIKFKRREAVVKQKTKSSIWPLPVVCRPDGFIIMTRKNPRFGFIENSKKTIANLLRISEESITDAAPLQSAGSKLMIPLNSLPAVFKIIPDLGGIGKYCIETGVKGFYPFTRETIDSRSDFHARQFNPLAGVNEDPVTGMAAGALGAYAKKYQLLGKNSAIVEQGYVLNKAGKVYIDLASGIKIGGYAVGCGKEILKV